MTLILIHNPNRPSCQQFKWLLLAQEQRTPPLSPPKECGGWEALPPTIPRERSLPSPDAALPLTSRWASTVSGRGTDMRSNAYLPHGKCLCQMADELYFFYLSNLAVTYGMWGCRVFFSLKMIHIKICFEYFFFFCMQMHLKGWSYWFWPKGSITNNHW